jgi:hypothetical protein
VAAAGLAVTVLTTGVMSAWNQSLAMIAGAAGLVVWCLVAVDATKRFGGLKGSLAATVLWFAHFLPLGAPAAMSDAARAGTDRAQQPHQGGPHADTAKQRTVRPIDYLVRFVSAS